MVQSQRVLDSDLGDLVYRSSPLLTSGVTLGKSMASVSSLLPHRYFHEIVHIKPPCKLNILRKWWNLPRDGLIMECPHRHLD